MQEKIIELALNILGGKELDWERALENAEKWGVDLAEIQEMWEQSENPEINACVASCVYNNLTDEMQEVFPGFSNFHNLIETKAEYLEPGIYVKPGCYEKLIKGISHNPSAPLNGALWEWFENTLLPEHLILMGGWEHA